MKQAFAPSALLAAVFVFSPLAASAHTGGALDRYGCHADHRKGDYHCHTGNLRGYSFHSREELQEAIRTGNFPEKPPQSEGFFQKLWPFGKKKAEPAPAAEGSSAQQAQNAPEPAPATTPAQANAAAPVPAGSPAPAPADSRSFEERLKVLSGLREMGLITQEEYNARRKAILDQL